MPKEVRYADAGVDTQEGARAVEGIRAAVQSTYRPEVVGDIGGFGGLFSLAAARKMQDPILVSGTDGVGTKLKLAQRFGKHNTIGQDLVAMCVNDILATGAEPLFFLDYIATGKLDADQVSCIVEGIAHACKLAGCSLIGGEMAEHPGVMADNDYDLSGFAVGLVDRPHMLSPERVQAKDVLIGLASSGVHSNGYSLVRKVCVDCLSDEELLEKRQYLDGKSLFQALIEPTKIYVRPVLDLLRAHPGAVRSLAHITGGGITENLNRALPSGLDAHVERGSWPVLPIFKDLIDRAHLSEDAAYRTFNMGLGMILVVDPAQAETVLEHLHASGEKAWVVGSVIPGQGQVVYQEAACVSH